MRYLRPRLKPQYYSNHERDPQTRTSTLGGRFQTYLELFTGCSRTVTATLLLGWAPSQSQSWLKSAPLDRIPSTSLDNMFFDDDDFVLSFD